MPEKKRNEVWIRVSDIPDPIFKKIAKQAKQEKRSHGKEVLLYLENSNYLKNG